MGQKDGQRCCFSGFSFEFAFDDPTFSDRTLKLVIFEDLLADEQGYKIDNYDLLDQAKYLKQIKQDISELEEGFRVKKLHIIRAILAARSSYFHKLFTTGMRECEQSEVALRIYSSEEAAFMDVLKFIYSSSLSANTPVALLKVLMTADKYDVPSCVSYCCKLLLSNTQTLEMAFLYIDLPSSIVFNNVDVQQLVCTSADFIANNLDDISKDHEQIKNLSTDGIKTLLSNDNLKVDSEDAAYDLYLELIEHQVPDMEQRCKVYNSDLCSIVRLEHMTPSKLKQILTVSANSTFSLEPAVSESILDAIVSNKRNYVSKCQRRPYKLSPVAVLAFDFPVLQCDVFWNLSRREFENLGRQDCQPFDIGSNRLYLSVQRDNDRNNLTVHLGLKESRMQSVTMKIDFQVRSEASEGQFVDYNEANIIWKFEKQNDGIYSHSYRSNYRSVYVRGYVVGEPCCSLSSRFINDIMHLKSIITIVSEKCG